MGMWLRQSTASQEILLGRFLDSGDGDTEEESLTINNTDIKLWKEGATTLADKNSGGATHISDGMYYAVLDATDTDTLGKLEVNVHVAGALSVRREYMVLPANVYDSLVLGTDYLQTDLLQMLGTTVTETSGGLIAAAFKKFFDKATPTGTINSIPDAVAGASGGILISGSNSGTTTLNALTVTNATTLSGAVSLGSTLGVTGATTFTGAVSATNASNDVRGVKLHADGLNSVSTTEPGSERPANFREWLMWLCRRFGNKHIVNQTLGTVVVRNDADNANLSSQPYTETSTVQTVDPLT